MRDIKFRAWNIELEVMVNECIDIGTNGVFAPSMKQSDVLARGDRYHIMQYTGLKDKNGKEIYEGDIVRAEAMRPYEKDSKVTDIVFGDDFQWQVRTSHYQHGLPINWGGWKSLEVIGNIYENAELLEAKQ